MVSVCFVCLGNICRSPTAEGVMASLVDAAGLARAVRLDSAGTGSWHVGEPPDRRATAAAAARGILLQGAARQFRRTDFGHFDYVVAMDRSNLRTLHGLAPDRQAADRVRLLRDFDPDSAPGSEVPDPYYGGGDGFERVLDICTAACQGLLSHIRREHGL